MSIAIDKREFLIMDYNYSDRLKNLGGNAIREIFKLLAEPNMISFAGGLPATDLLPIKAVAAMTDKVMSSKSAAAILQYGETEGYRPLREAAPAVLSRVGIKDVTVDKTLIISGGQQGIDLTLKLFLNKGDVMLVEDPTYLAALHIAKTYEVKAVGVDSDADGINIDDLKRKIEQYKPKLLYVVPTFSNPTGKTMTVSKRKAIAELTAEYGIIVLEDDPYSELRFAGERVPAMKSFDECGNIIYVTSFSKTISPGLRTGYAFAAPEVIKKLTVGKQAVDVHTSTLSQAIITEFITSGLLFENIEKAKPLYKTKKDAMLEAIKRYMPKEFEHTDPEGGLFIWGEFPTYIDAATLFPEVCKQGVAYVSGESFFADGSGRNTIRLNYSNASLEQIDTGMRSLGGFFSRQIRG